MSDLKLPAGSSIGILGAGQLGRMLAQAANKLGFKVHIFSPENDAPAAAFASAYTKAAYDDEAALERFAQSVDVITYEFENVPARTAEILSARCFVAPSAQALDISQDRLKEKNFLKKHGIQTAAFAPAGNLAEIEAAFNTVGTPAVLKTRRFGYDGKGQAIVKTIDDAKKAFFHFGNVDVILEGFVPFTSELSVIGARDTTGRVALYDPATNEHRDHILYRSYVPAKVSSAVVKKAQDTAKLMLQELDYIGVIGIEFFVTDTAPYLLVNEFAPRVHNSGHWTMDACDVSQFEQHIRAITGLNVKNPQRHADIIMQNLIGDEILSADDLAKAPGTVVHVYGKNEIRPGRKMGHFNRLYPLAAGLQNADG